MNGRPSPTVTTAHPSLPRGRIRGCGLFPSGSVRSGSRQAGPLRTDSTWAVFMPCLFHASWQGRKVQLATRSLSPFVLFLFFFFCPLSKLSLSLLLQEATQCFSAISLMKFLKGSNCLYTSPAFPQPSPLCVQHRTELTENNDKEPVGG